MSGGETGLDSHPSSRGGARAARPPRTTTDRSRATRVLSWRWFVFVQALSLLAGSVAYGLNPIVPDGYFGADPAARQWADGRMYVYGSHDTSKTSWCSNNYHLFSSADLVTWLDHGEFFHSSGPSDDVPWTDARLYAPDAVYRDGVYYLYFSLSQDTDDEGVAVGTSPWGPFSDASVVKSASGIDPSVFIDDDGQAYMYWGQHASSAAKLKANLTEIDQSTLTTNLLTEASQHFHEGSSMRKRNGVYYYVFADISRRGKPTCLGYATSSSPLGPFTYRGVIIDNYAADPATWNNHGSIVEFNGQWYVLYHRASHGSKYMRKICIEPIAFAADGTIPEVVMTTQGAGGPLNPYDQIEAELACELSGTTRTEDCSEDGDDLGFITNGSHAVYRYLDFGSGAATFTARVASAGSGGDIEVHLDSDDGILIATCKVPNTCGWQTWQTVTCPVTGAAGMHALYLRFSGGNGNLLNLNWFQFSPAGAGCGDSGSDGSAECGVQGGAPDADGPGTAGDGGVAACPVSDSDNGGCACRTPAGAAEDPRALPVMTLIGLGAFARHRRRRSGAP